MTVAVLQAHGLHRFFRRGGEEIAALRDVSIDLSAGELVAVMGPSGSGKSTLLNLLAGLDDPDGGSVLLSGERLSHQTSSVQSRIRARQIGVMTQSSGLVEHLDVVGNVKLAGSFRATSASTTEIGRLLESVGLTDQMNARPSTLSGGETARANLAVALVGDPSILLADEPTAEVSASEEVSILALLRDLQSSRRATLVVTHSSAVAKAADRVIELVDGKIR